MISQYARDVKYATRANSRKVLYLSEVRVGLTAGDAERAQSVCPGDDEQEGPHQGGGQDDRGGETQQCWFVTLVG